MRIRKYSIKSQLVATLMIIIISFLVMSMINYWYSINALTRKLTESRLNVLSETAQNLDQLFSGVKSRAAQIKYDVNVQRVLTEDFLLNGYEGYNANDQAQKVLQNITLSWEYIKSIHVVPTEVIVRNKNTTSGFINKKNIQNNAWYNMVDKSSLKGTWLPTRMSEETFIANENIYTYVLPITNLYNDSKIIGHVFVNIKESSLYSILRSNNADKDSKIVLIDEKNRVFFDSDRIYGNKSVDQNLFSKEGFQGLSGHYFTGKSSDKQLVIYSTVPETGWKIITGVPFSGISAELNQLKQATYTAIVICSFISLLVAFILYKGISKPLNDIAIRIMNIGRGDFTQQEYDITSKNELERINNNFNWMSKRIAQLIDRNTLTLAQKREAEFKALQAQINPHFLYNTLDTINWLAMLNDQKDISSMVMNLSKFYRNSLNGGREMILIEEELAHAKAFLEIEKYSYKNRFDVNFNIDNRLLKYYTIKLILQPLVENAIIHGFKEKEGKGKICLQLYSKSDTIYFEVIDDGRGMDEEQIKRVLTEKTAGYGVANVDERIKLRFGEQHGVTYKSQKGIGTTAIISIPFVEQQMT